jgi:hypothetical protein
MYRQTRDTYIESELKLYFCAIKKRSAQNAQDGNGVIHSTKLPLPFSVYIYFCKQFIIGNERQADAISYMYETIACRV